MIGHIYLVTHNGKTIPALIITKKNGRYRALPLAKGKTKGKGYFIGRPEGLREPSCLLFKPFSCAKEELKKRLTSLSPTVYEQAFGAYIEERKKDRLHEELHRLKKKILLAQMNNERYGDLERRKNEILKELNYVHNPRGNGGKGYRNYREVPTKGWIKVYHGGR